MPLPAHTTSLRDRTPEFLIIAERLQRQLGPSLGISASASTSYANGSISSKPDPTPSSTASRTLGQSSEFAKKAAEIGHGIHRTSLKLQKLAQLAKRTSMFDDPAQEVDELTGVIKQDIQGLNSSIVELQRVSGKAAAAREENKQSSDHSHTVVDNLRSRLKDATAEFKDVLTLRTENLKHHKERRQLFSANVDAEASLPLLARHRTMGASANLNGPAGGGLGSSSSGSFLPASQQHQQQQQLLPHQLQQQQHQPPPPPSFLQQQQQQLTLANPQDSYLSSRAEALRNVETTIIELGGIFQKLSEMVAEQGEMAIRIDENIDDTLGNVTNAQAQLLKYLNTISSNRWLILKVFGVLLVFLLIFIMFIA